MLKLNASTLEFQGMFFGLISDESYMAVFIITCAYIIVIGCEEVFKGLLVMGETY